MLGKLKPQGPKQSGRKHGLSTEQDPVSAYAGSSKNLKDLKDAFVAYFDHTINVWGIGGDEVGLIERKKAPKHQSTTNANDLPIFE